MAPVIFLDIDGFLIPYPKGGAAGPVFTPRCVEAFKLILAARAIGQDRFLDYVALGPLRGPPA